MARMSEASLTCRSAIRAICSRLGVAASSRLMAYSAAVRRSRRRADSAWYCRRAVSVLITKPIESIARNVNRYCASSTLNFHRGGTKQKSKAAVPRNAARIDGPRPQRSATITTPNK